MAIKKNQMGLIVAVSSFMPSLFYTNLIVLMLIPFLGYKNINLKLLIVILLGATYSIMASAYFEYASYWKHVFLYFFIISGIVLISSTEVRNKRQFLEAFIKAHVYISLLEIPIQLIQFVNEYGLNAGLFLVNSSAGDVGHGTIYNSALLSYKQIISLFFVLMFPALFTKQRVAMLFALAFSILFIGANHAILAVIASIGIATVLTKFNAKRAIILSVVLLLLFVVFNVLFASQTQYVMNTFSRFDLEEFARIRVLFDWLDIDNGFSGLQTLFTGKGLGVYGSRTSYIMSGEYLRGGEMPLLGVNMINDFKDYLLPLWNKEITSNLYISGTYYMPFSSYTSIFMEMGLIGLIVMLLVIHWSAMISGKVIGFSGLVFVVFVSIMFFLDNFIEYPRFMLPVLIAVFYMRSLRKEFKDEYFVFSTKRS